MVEVEVEERGVVEEHGVVEVEREAWSWSSVEKRAVVEVKVQGARRDEEKTEEARWDKRG